MADRIDDMAEIHRIIFETPDSSDDSFSSFRVKIQGAIQSRKVPQRHVVMNNVNKQAPRQLQPCKFGSE